MTKKTKPTSKITQINTTQLAQDGHVIVTIVALCEDSSIWITDNFRGDWVCVHDALTNEGEGND